MNKLFLIPLISAVIQKSENGWFAHANLKIEGGVA
jgi:hypothetical protein